MSTKNLAFMFCIVLFSIAPMNAIAQEKGDTHEWQFAADVYLWGASVGGETASGGDIDVDFDDIFKDLKMGFMGIFAARKNNWSFFVDAIYLDVEDDSTISGMPASAELTAWIVTPDVGYTVLRGDRGHLDVHVGARYLYLKPEVRLGALGAEDTNRLWDGIIGVRGAVDFTDKLYLPYYVDVGTGDSDMTWQVLVGLGYRFKYFDAVAGYRYLDYEFEDNLLADSLNLSGPYAGLRFTF